MKGVKGAPYGIFFQKNRKKAHERNIEGSSHLVGEDVDDAFAELAGVDLGRTRENEDTEPVQCEKCHFVNPPGTRFCGKCGIGLTADAQDSAQGILAELWAIPDENPALALETLQKARR